MKQRRCPQCGRRLFDAGDGIELLFRVLFADEQPHADELVIVCRCGQRWVIGVQLLRPPLHDVAFKETAS